MAGYPVIPTSKSTAWANVIAATHDPVRKAALMVIAEKDLPSVEEIYLSPPEIREQILGRLVELHGECLLSRLAVDPDSLLLSVGDRGAVVAQFFNEHRPVLPRRMSYESDDPYWMSVDTGGVVSARADRLE